MKILLLGKNGRIGWELQRALAPLGQVIALDRQGCLDLSGNLSDLEAIAATVRALKPDIIVNAAAYTAVDKAESEAMLATRINTQAPTVLASQAAAIGAWLIHYSTNYVFDGSGQTPWVENTPTHPLSIYGRTKRDGEIAIAASGANAIVLRTSWIYATRGQNFAKTMLRFAKERDSLSIVADQFGAPTGAELVADVTAHIIRNIVICKDASQLTGIYHVTAAGETSWHGYAQFVLKHAARQGHKLQVDPEEIDAIATEEYLAAAARPRNARLNPAKLEKVFNLKMPPWQQGVLRMLEKIQP